jgi:hypothetical protein
MLTPHLVFTKHGSASSYPLLLSPLHPILSLSTFVLKDCLMQKLKVSEPIDPLEALEALLLHGVADIETPADWSWKKQVTALMSYAKEQSKKIIDLENRIAELEK